MEEKREGVVIKLDTMEAHSEEDGERGVGLGGRWMSSLDMGSDQSIPNERFNSWM